MNVTGKGGVPGPKPPGPLAMSTALAQGGELQAIAFAAVVALKDVDPTSEEAGFARSHLQAVAAGIKAWRDARSQVRTEQQKPNQISSTSVKSTKVAAAIAQPKLRRRATPPVILPGEVGWSEQPPKAA